MPIGAVLNKRYNKAMTETTGRHYSPLDQLCLTVDQALRAFTGKVATSGRTNPAASLPEPALTPTEAKHAAGLMRVNHAGEVCAQALYHGQALVSRDPLIKAHLQYAAVEEGDHLAWCSTRLLELQSHTSYLNPVFYMGSFAIGMAAGVVGDQWSLGFVAETERQVAAHLEKHLDLLPPNDTKSARILQMMHTDELSHRDDAIKAGAATLPRVIQKLMRLTSRVMVKTAYWA
jgi:ubiquinone biosynthesis monooxygenase Coq7